MREQRGRTVEVESLAEFDARVAAGAKNLDGWHLQAVDLRGRGELLRSLEPCGALFLGCPMQPEVELDLRSRGALVFPVVPDVPVDTYRAGLYTPAELYDGLTDDYATTLDARVYAWSRQEPTLDVSLAQALHDHAVDDALRAVAREHDLVGVMGGHSLARRSEEYAAAALLGSDLAVAGRTVLTGGGPGAMEAANLGAYLSRYPRDSVAEALEVLAPVPSYMPSVTDWARSAFTVRDRWPDGGVSIGIPTWHYGHEPPNVFASHVAKYFKNAIREDILLHLASAGIVFLPGAAGTVQEIFQDACENYYADPSSVAPMVLVGRRYWTEVVPAWPLLRSLAGGRAMEGLVHLVDDVAEVPGVLGG